MVRAKIDEYFDPDTALPQLTTRFVLLAAVIPNVSPGQIEAAP